jgi:3',5'-cyclic-AMP phosphodiesterase
MERACRWVAGVAGNHDRLGSIASLDAAGDALCGTHAHLLDGSTAALDGIRVGGLCGIVGSVHGPWVRREDEYNAALGWLMREGCDLLVLHDGPNVAGTDLPGWPSVRRVLEAAPPVLVIRGHDHWPSWVQELGNGTQVLNVEGRVVVLQRRTGGLTGGT